MNSLVIIMPAQPENINHHSVTLWPAFRHSRTQDSVVCDPVKTILIRAVVSTEGETKYRDYLIVAH